MRKEIHLELTYACTPYYPELVNNVWESNIELIIDIDLFWDVLHTQLRGLVINYSF